MTRSRNIVQGGPNWHAPQYNFEFLVVFLQSVAYFSMKMHEIERYNK